MNQILDKLIIFICSLALYFTFIKEISVVPIIIIIIIGSLNSYFDKIIIQSVLSSFYCLLCLLYPSLVIFIPIVFYDTMYIKYMLAVFVFVLLFNINTINIINFIYIIIFIIIAFLINYRTKKLERMKKDYYEILDREKEYSILFENKQKKLLEKQDYEINLATLNERNRIAGEIHDNLGHDLSRAILQVGALITINKDNKIKENLEELRNSLSDGMDNIRKSIHNLHHDSIDLYTETSKLIKGFNFCPVDFDYDIEKKPEIKIVYCFINVIKEALSNIIKHSNAAKASITLREHPAFYQLIIYDNGQKIDYKPDKGIGLENIKDRVTKLEGIVNFNHKNGFEIFISIPK